MSSLREHGLRESFDRRGFGLGKIEGDAMAIVAENPDLLPIMAKDRAEAQRFTTHISYCI